ncbi:MAG: hypothetical protein AB7D07_01740 [Desulfovibrionaceae bacterium]
MQLEPLTRATLTALLEQQEPPAISIYTPTAPATERSQANKASFKGLLQTAGGRLESEGYPAEDLLAPAWKLYEDESFWESQSQGLALFISQKARRFFRLPIDVAPTAVVDVRFDITQLIPLCAQNTRYYILALKPDDVRLLQCMRYGPLRPRESLTAPISAEQPGLPDDGGRPDLSKKNMRRTQAYFQQIDAGLAVILDRDHAPLILAGDSELTSIYRNVNTYPHLLSQTVPNGSPATTPEELQFRAQDVVRPFFQGQLQAALDEFHKKQGVGLTASGLAAVSQAAEHGRIATLFLQTDTPGCACSENPEPELAPTDSAAVNKKLNLTAIQTLKAEGVLYCLDAEDFPTKKAPAAILRP